MLDISLLNNFNYPASKMADVLELENVEEFEDGGADREVRVTMQDDDFQTEKVSILSVTTGNGALKEKSMEVDDQSVSQLKEKAKRRKGRGFGAGDDRNDRGRDAYDRYVTKLVSSYMQHKNQSIKYSYISSIRIFANFTILWIVQVSGRGRFRSTRPSTISRRMDPFCYRNS